jgi:hypothetical protein
MIEWDAEKELEAAEADWAMQRAKLKEPVNSGGDYASWQWTRVASWFGIVGVPLLLIFANPYFAGGFSVLFGLVSLASLSAINPNNCRNCKDYENRIKMF